MSCTACGHRLPAGAKFCPECGAPVAAQGATAGARKIVTILFADLAGSTALHERLDPESARQFMERYYRAMRGAVAAHGGTVVKLLGDGVMAAFGVPRVNEDDAIRAVRGAFAMLEAFSALAAERGAGAGEIGLRVGLNTGEVVVSADDTDVVGDPVNVAARLQEEAGTGEVVIGEATQRLVAGTVTLEALGSVALKGRAESVTAYRVASLARPAGAAAAAFVGRGDELARLKSVYDSAVAAAATRLAVVLGSPGLGKSRLLDELTSRLGGAAAVVTAHCDAGGGATFAPLASALRRHLRIDAAAGADTIRAAVEAAMPAGDGERRRVAAGIAALLLGSPAAPEETFFVVRRLLTALAAARPVVLVIDDLHWAEPLLLDLVEHLVQWGSGVPMLVLVGARPELRDLRAALTTAGGVVAAVVTLSGLDAGAATRLAANVIGAADLPAAVAAKVLATSEGNPLFVGELVRMLVQEGALTQDGERWIVGANLAALEMPPTIQALLAARIERLQPEERAVLECAAVVGRHFSRHAIAALMPDDTRALDVRLAALQRSDLIEPANGWFLGEPVLRFHHVLIRDAAYRRLLKGTRAALHERLAGWIEAQAGASGEHDETIGRHLEQAHQHLRELGPLDAKGRELGERAARRLAAAGRRALARDDVPPAASLLGRAIDMLDAADPGRAELALDWCEALLSAGDVGPSARAIDELQRLIPHVDGPAARARISAWHTCFSGQLTALTAPQALQASADAVAAAADDLARLGDAAGEAKAHSVHAQALARLGKVGSCEAALDKALAAARKAGDRRRANAVLAGAPVAALWGPSPVTRASGRCLDVVRVLRITEGAPAVEAVALSCQGVLEALRGRTDAARRMVAASRQMVEELGIAHRLFEADVFAGRIDLLEGDAAGAERVLRGAYDGLRELGLGIDAARAGALLARAQLAQGKIAEAQALSHASEALAGDDLQAAIAWRGARAEALARRGESGAAVELAQAAVDIAVATDALLDHADARLALAVALHAAGRAGDAAAEERRAIELWQAKGATLLADRADRHDRAAAGSGGGSPATPAAAAGQQATPAAGRARTNAASSLGARFIAAFERRDIDALEALFSPDLEVVDHPTGAIYGRPGNVDSLRRLLRTAQPQLQFEPLATAGERLLLARRRIAASGAAGGRFDVAAWRREEVLLIEVDAHGICERLEIFADEALGDAISRMYERQAEHLHEPRARAHAAGKARTMMRMSHGLADTTRLENPFSPTVDWIDHRLPGVGTIHGDSAVLAAVSAFLELATDVRWRCDAVLAYADGALLSRATNLGTDRSGGGTFSRTILSLTVFDSDGRIARWETFEVTQEEQALACFDAAIAPPQRRLLARLGESLCLLRRGTNRAEEIGVAEVDTDGTELSSERFPADRLGDAVVRLYQRYAERLADAASRSRAAATAGAIAAMVAPPDIDRYASALAPDVDFIDHRTVGFASGRGAEQLLRGFGSLLEHAAGVATRVDDIVAVRPDALLLRWTTSGTDRASGGAFESSFLLLWAFGADGRIIRDETFDDGREVDALQRLAALAGDVRPNRASRTRAAVDQVFKSKDWEAMRSLAGPSMQFEDRRHWAMTSGGVDMWIESAAAVQTAFDVALHDDIIATFGERIDLRRRVVTGVSPDGGSFEREFIVLTHVDGDGKLTASINFDLEARGDAVAEARRRWRADADGAGDTAGFATEPAPCTARGRVATPARVTLDRVHAAMQAACSTGDWDALRARCAETMQFEDRQRLARVRGDRETMIASLQARAATGARPTLTRIGDAGERIAMARMLWTGGPADGRFEIEYLTVLETDADGHAVAVLIFDADDPRAAQREAWARWAAIEPETAGLTSPLGQMIDAFNAHDRRGWRAALADDLTVNDHRRTGFGRLTGPDRYIESLAVLWELAPQTRVEAGWQWLARDRHGAVTLLRRTGTLPDAGDFESVYLFLLWAAGGRATHIEYFEVEDRDAALARFAELRQATSAE